MRSSLPRHRALSPAEEYAEDQTDAERDAHAFEHVLSHGFFRGLRAGDCAFLCFLQRVVRRIQGSLEARKDFARVFPGVPGGGPQEILGVLNFPFQSRHHPLRRPSFVQKIYHKTTLALHTPTVIQANPLI
jgi:hypothetical protein